MTGRCDDNCQIPTCPDTCYLRLSRRSRGVYVARAILTILEDDALQSPARWHPRLGWINSDVNAEKEVELLNAAT